jgi:hypothetical protein
MRRIISPFAKKLIVIALSGHRTRSVFDRYNIVSPKDLVEAARHLERCIDRYMGEGEETPLLPAPAEIDYEEKPRVNQEG